MRKIVSVRAEIHYLERVQVGLLPSATYPATAKSFIFPQTLPQEATSRTEYCSCFSQHLRICNSGKLPKPSAGKHATSCQRGKTCSQSQARENMQSVLQLLTGCKKEDPRFLLLLVYSVQLTKLLINCRAR